MSKPISQLFESLDYLYLPAPEVEAAITFYTDVLGGKLLWRIRDGRTWVAAVCLAVAGPLVLSPTTSSLDTDC